MARLTSQDLAQLLADSASEGPAATPETSGPRRLTSAELAAEEARGAPPSRIESFMRGAVEGATFGYDTSLGLQDRRQRELSSRTNPMSHFIGELAGGILPMALTGGATATTKGAAVAARQVGAITTPTAAKLIKGATTAEKILLPSEATTLPAAMLQGAKIGVPYGALSGSGHNEDNRLEGALFGAGTGAVLGPVFGAGGHVLGKLVGRFSGAKAAADAETADANQGALLATTRALERDRIAPQELAQQIRAELPRSKEVNKSLALDQDGVLRLAQMRLAGRTRDEIATELNIAPTTVSRYFAEMDTKSLGPLNLIDRTALVRPGSGSNTQMTMRAAAAAPSEAQAIAREQLVERQLNGGNRLTATFERLIGSSDFEGVAQQHAARLEKAANAAYDAARAAEKPFDLNPIFERYRERFQGQRGPVPETMIKAMDDMHVQVPIRNQVTGGTVTNELRAPRTLEQFINARQNLSDEIDAAVRSGRNNVARQLTQLKNDLSAEVARTNPQWKAANDLFRDGRAAEDMLAAGARMSTRLNARTREGLESFDAAQAMLKSAQAAKDQAKIDAAQAQIYLFRVGLVRSLSEQVRNTNATNDLTRVLRLPAARDTLRRVLGEKDAAQLLRAIESEHAMNRTYASQFGSQTTPLAHAIEDLNWAPRLSSAWQLFNPREIVNATGEAISRRFQETRNQQLMKLLTNENPSQQLDLLKALGAVANARSRGLQSVSLPTQRGIGPVTSAAVGGQNEEWRRQRRRAPRGLIEG